MRSHVSGFWHLKDKSNFEEAELDNLMAAFFAIFYANDAYLTLRDAEFLQCALDIIIELFAWVGLQTNTKKMQTMICTLGRICTQLPAETYRWMLRGQVSASEWNAQPAECCQCGKVILASSLGRHRADVHDI